MVETEMQVNSYTDVPGVQTRALRGGLESGGGGVGFTVGVGVPGGPPRGKDRVLRAGVASGGGAIGVTIGVGVPGGPPRGVDRVLRAGVDSGGGAIGVTIGVGSTKIGRASCRERV